MATITGAGGIQLVDTFKIIMVRQDRNSARFHGQLEDLATYCTIAPVLVGSWSFAALVPEDEGDTLAELAQEEFGLCVKVINANGGALMEKYFPHEFHAHNAAKAEEEKRAWFAKTFNVRHSNQDLEALRLIRVQSIDGEKFTCDGCSVTRLCPFVYHRDNVLGACSAVK